MIEKKFKKLGLNHFNYKKTAWFQTIRNENRNYKYNLLLFSLLFASLVPVVFLAFEFAGIGTGRLSILLLQMGVLAILLLLLMKWKKLRPIIYVWLILPIIGLTMAVMLPGGKNVYLLLLSAYPVLAVQLRGSHKGAIWFGVFFGSFVLGYAAQSAGLVPAWSARLPVIDLITVAGSSFAVFLLAFFAERRQESMIARLTDLLVFNEVTGLPNKDVLANSIETDKNYIFAIIKIENFSDLVALFGYEFSDTISQFASQKLRKYENRFRYKTYQLKYNEYGILLRTEVPRSVSSAVQLLTDVINSLEIEALPWEKDLIRLVYRVGGTIVCPDDCRNPLSKADVALKKAERGFSVISLYDEDNDEKKTAYDYVIKFTELSSNRENKTFKAVFQPIFNGDGSAIVWYEALLRIQRQDGSYTSIYPYLNVAKSTGFYQHLTDFILRESAEAIVKYDIDVSINISINDIVRPEFIALVDAAYDMIRNKKGRIIFEILESDELVELDKCIWFIDYIARYGFKIAIDDFGTGYSNYSTLVNLPIDIVKIDGSLIRKIKTDENAKILVEGIVHFCKKSNKKTVAEFVEDIDVYDSIKHMNIDFLQGYYFAEPSSFSTSDSFSVP